MTKIRRSVPALALFAVVLSAGGTAGAKSAQEHSLSAAETAALFSPGPENSGPVIPGPESAPVLVIVSDTTTHYDQIDARLLDADPEPEIPVFQLPGQVSPTRQHRPAAWAGGSEPGQGFSLFSNNSRILLDTRGFYHKTSDDRPDWFGVELLSYFDAVPGLSGAAVVRNETRDTTGNYASLMLIPQVSRNQFMVFSAGVGDGALFMPLTRLDLSLRGFFDRWDYIMYEVGYMSTWWPGDRYQFAQSNAVIFWLQQMIIEVRETLYMTDPHYEAPRLNMHGSGVVLVGMDKRHWILTRLHLGTEPENRPGLKVSESRDLPVGTFAFGYRQWITEQYGVQCEFETYGQWGTWYRFGLTISVFADLH